MDLSLGSQFRQMGPKHMQKALILGLVEIWFLPLFQGVVLLHVLMLVFTIGHEGLTFPLLHVSLKAVGLLQQSRRFETSLHLEPHYLLQGGRVSVGVNKKALVLHNTNSSQRIHRTLRLPPPPTPAQFFRHAIDSSAFPKGIVTYSQLSISFSFMLPHKKVESSTCRSLMSIFYHWTWSPTSLSTTSDFFL